MKTVIAKNKIINYLAILFGAIPFCTLSFPFLSLKIYETQFYDLSRTLVKTVDFNFFELIKNGIFGFSMIGMTILLLMVSTLIVAIINLKMQKKWLFYTLLALSLILLIIFSCLNTLYCKGNGLLSANYIRKTNIPETFPNFPIVVEETVSIGEFYWVDLGVSSFISVFSYSGLLISLLLDFFLKIRPNNDLESLSHNNNSTM